MTPHPSAPDDTWLVAGHGDAMLVGPERALATHPHVRGRVHLAEPVTDLGGVSTELSVAESGVRTFVVPWHQLTDGRTVAVHPIGGNQALWHPGAPTDIGVTPAPDAHLTDVHVRFVLRHLTTILLEDDLGGRSIHAVAAGSGSGVLAVAGPTQSGKTRLVNHLVSAGLVDGVVDDDCPVLGPHGVLGMLVPRRHEVARAACRPLRTLVLLADDAGGTQQLDVAEAHRFLDGTATPWPAAWLPTDGPRVLPELPSDVSVVVAPAQDESAFADVVALLSSL